MTRIGLGYAGCAFGALLQAASGCAQKGNEGVSGGPPVMTTATDPSGAPTNADSDAINSPAMMAPAMAAQTPASPATMKPAAQGMQQPAAANPQAADASAPQDNPAMNAGDALPWESLITAEWQLGPNEERYFCQRTTLREEIYFSAIRAVNPLGTHHTALTAQPGMATEPDGLTECSSALDPQGIFGSGVGTNAVVYPKGVGLRLRAGQQLLLNLHVFNTSDKPLSGMSGTEIVKTTADKVEHVAESLLAGPVALDLPAHQVTSVSGTCTMTQDATLFAVQPHMHQLGIHMKGVAESSVAGSVVLHDGDYSFDNQIVYSIDPVEMRQGDVVNVECTFDNTTDNDVTLGESSTAEMCFMVLHRYPAPADPSVTCFF